MKKKKLPNRNNLIDEFAIFFFDKIEKKMCTQSDG